MNKNQPNCQWCELWRVRKEEEECNGEIENGVDGVVFLILQFDPSTLRLKLKPNFAKWTL